MTDELLRRILDGDPTVVVELRAQPASKPHVYANLWDEMVDLALDAQLNPPADNASEA